jgi:hypothetical protein
MSSTNELRKVETRAGESGAAHATTLLSAIHGFFLPADDPQPNRPVATQAVYPKPRSGDKRCGDPESGLP